LIFIVFNVKNRKDNDSKQSIKGYKTGIKNIQYRDYLAISVDMEWKNFLKTYQLSL